MSLVRINSVACSRARAQIPAWGVWWVDVDLVEASELSGSVSIDFAGVTMVGTVVSGGVVEGRAAYRIAGGAAGWGTTLSAQGYRDDGNGVKVATILADAARVAGETLAGVPTTRVGGHFARARGPASALLHSLAPRSWYVDFAGVTQIGTRAETEYQGSAPIVRIDRRAGVYEIATEDPSALIPGVSVLGSAPATDVEWELEPRRLTVRIFASDVPSRRLAAWLALLDAADPLRAFRAVHEYRVVQQSGAKLDLQIVRSGSGMPDLSGVPVRLAPGVRADFLPGALVTVAFLGGNPAYPRVISGDDDGAPGWMPLLLEVGEAPTLGVVRLTDTVQAGPFAGVTTGASARIKAGL